MRSLSPGVVYFSWSHPNKIIETFTPKMAKRAAISLMPFSWSITMIMIDELSEYSTQRKMLRPPISETASRKKNSGDATTVSTSTG